MLTTHILIGGLRTVETQNYFNKVNENQLTGGEKK